MTIMKDLTVKEFINVTASDAPAPGGGSVAALSGALGMALAEMAANLTIGKEKYADVDAEMRVLAEKSAEIRNELAEGIQRDTESFTAYMKALRMPKETEAEKTVRREAMQKGLKEAAEVPLSIAEAALKIFPIAEAVIDRGNKTVQTDGIVAAMLARTAVISALLNVRVNLVSIKDEIFVEKVTAKVHSMEEQAIEYEKRILKNNALTNDIEL